VLAWDWNAATLVSLNSRVNTENTVHQGHLLAAALRGAGLDPARVHLIGHSSGTIVATSAARAVLVSTGRPIAHLTLLEPAASYHSVVFDQLGAGSSAVVVENYWLSGPSAYGRAVPHAGVRNFRVPNKSPYFGVICPTCSDHLYIIRWYLGTIASPARRLGFNGSMLLMPGA